mgnify:CR=1 FL=1
MNALMASCCFAAIVLPDSPTAVERTAADELKAAVRRISGEEWQIVPERAEPAGERNFLIGATRAAARIAPAAWRTDEILVAPLSNGSIVLAGDPVRGPIYAVDTYLEDVCGVRWWTSAESDYPTLREMPPVVSAIRHAPVFRYRETYYRDGFNADFKVRMKGNFSSRTRFMYTPMEFIPKEKGGDHRLYYFESRGSAYHSHFETLPPSRHFASHPEWYSEIGGRRVAKQLCLSNDEMAEAYIAETLRRLRTDPAVDFISVSQNDWAGPCDCVRCRAVIAEEGAISGLYLRFANRVAEAVEREFPSVTVDTFAYRFTRKPPRLTRPRRNVTVRLCDIECAFNAPIATSGLDDDFLADLREWGRLAPGRLYIWDYATDFVSYMMPHPNLDVLGPNLRLFAESGVTGVFEQGDALCSAGSFAALEHWVIAHLLWDPSRDARGLRDAFILGYYGEAAAPHVRRCRDIVDGAGAKAAAQGIKVGCYHLSVTNFMDRATALAAADALDRAIDAAERFGGPYAERLRREKLSFDHMKLVSWKDWGLEGSRDEAFRAWAAECRRFGVEAWRETTDRGDFGKYLEANGCR